MSVAGGRTTWFAALPDIAVLAGLFLVFLWLYYERILILPGYLVLVVGHLIRNTLLWPFRDGLLSPIFTDDTWMKLFFGLVAVGLGIPFGILSHRIRSIRSGTRRTET